jgi:hypothetical protein
MEEFFPPRGLAWSKSCWYNDEKSERRASTKDDDSNDHQLLASFNTSTPPKDVYFRAKINHHL